MTTSRSARRAQASEISLGLWTAWAFLLAFAMLETQDVLLFLSIHAPDPVMVVLRRTLVYVVPAILGFGLGLGLLQSFRHAVIGASALALGLFSATSLRGLWIRAGSLDDWQLPAALWARTFFGMLTVGLVGGLALWAFRRPTLSLRLAWGLLGFFVVLGLASSAMLLTGGSGSVFAPTRPLPLFCAALLGGGLLIAEGQNG